MGYFFHYPRTAGRLSRLIVVFLCASGALIALVLSVRGTALAQGAKVDVALPHPQNSGVDLSITKTHASRFFVGDTGVYTIYVKNLGSPINPPFTVTITDTLPSTLKYNGSQGSGWNCNNPSNSNNVICTLALTQPLNTNDFLPLLQIKVNLNLKPATVQKVDNIVWISDTAGTNNIFTDTTGITTNLTISKAVLPNVISPTRIVTFTLQVKNNGPNDTTGVKVTDTLPGVLTINGAKPIGQYNSTSGVWSVGNLAKDETRTLVITATVKDGACGQVYTNTVEGMSSDLIDPLSSDNVASAVFTVKNTCVVGKVLRSDNNAPIQMARVQIRDSQNRTYTYTTAADGIFTFTNYSAYPLAAGNAVFQASAIGYRPRTNIPFTLQPDIKNGPVEIKLDPIAQLELLKSDRTQHIIPGETITYTIPITNLGVLNASNLVISDVIDSQLTFITYTLTDKNGKIPHTAPSPVNRVYTWTLSSSYILTATEKLTLAIRVKVADPLASGTNQIDNKISLRYNEDGLTRVNKTATDFSYTPNFEIVQNSVSPTEAKINERFTFSFRVYNRHPQVSATSVVFTNTFPSYLSFSSSSPSGSYNSSNRVFSVDLGTIAPGTYKDVTIIMTVNNVASSTQTLNNTGTARFEHGGKKQWRSSNTVQYRILGTSTLPGTGFGPPAPSLNLPSPLGRGVGGEGLLTDSSFLPASSQKITLTQTLFDFPTAFWVALGIGILLLGGGFLGIAFSLINPRSEWASWARQMGGVVTIAGLFFFGAAWWIQQSLTPLQIADVVLTPTQPPTPQPAQIAFPPPEWWDAQPDKLPDYPIPTPTITADQSERKVDDTPPTRLLIPKLGVDAVVKYVPFDGFSWLIAGLQDEIAWMGSTSWPGLGGNTALAGHVTLRNGADGPFRYLETLQNGDEIRLITEEAVYLYRVRESLVVKDDDFSVVQPTQEAILTLITCTGWNSDLGHYLERLVVRATLEKSQPLSGLHSDWLPVWAFGSGGK
jgi:LPXTG-site transpeptidase (sortase) family protein